RGHCCGAALCTSPAQSFGIVFIPIARPLAIVRHMKIPLPLLRSRHLLVPVAIVLFASWVIALQVEERNDFAGSHVAQDVESRWGAPVIQPAPSLRYVQSGTIFTELKALPFDQQQIQIDAKMNYRKRGLRYFSGFDFALTAAYRVRNVEPNDIDV